MSNSVIAGLRVVHIVFGAFWLGGAMTVGFFLLPAIRAAGSVGDEFAARLMSPMRLLSVITAAGAIAIGAGLVLYAGIWSGLGFDGPPRWYAMGGHVALLAIILSGVVTLPAAYKLAVLTRTVGSHASPPPEQNAQRDRLIRRATVITQIAAVLLVVTISLMAIGRYM
jgi:uncharacterized membrane protein